MSQPTEFSPPENPFATRWVRPGAIPYHFAPQSSRAQLIERLEANGWWGEITGPHGAGKSTLLAALGPELQSAGRRVIWIALSDGQRRLPPQALAGAKADPKVQVIVDGYEQLGRFSRAHLRHRCRRSGWGLVVTAHGPIGFPVLARVEPDLPTVLWIVDHLLARSRPLVSHEEVAHLFAVRGGNVRETLFDLYDLYEAHRRTT